MGKSSPTKIQAKHIPAKALIDLVDRLWNAPIAYGAGEYVRFQYPNGVTFADICKYWDKIPPKVIQQKLKKLIDTNYLDGCHCGCSTGIRVIHETDLPFIELVDVVDGKLVKTQNRISRELYHTWSNRGFMRGQ